MSEFDGVTEQTIERLQGEIGRLTVQNMKLNAALTFYANEANWPERVTEDRGEVARVILGGGTMPPTKPRGRP